MIALRIFTAAIIAPLPSFAKIWIYRHIFHYTIGRGVRIGLSAFVNISHCKIGDNVTIGHLNLFMACDRIQISENARIGFLNIFRGGKSVSIGRFATILRQNVINSIPKPDAVNLTIPEFVLGDGGVITSNHWLDFTDRITIGPHTIVGGRNSSLWTHNRQRTRQITIGHHCYLGSEIRLAPGTEIAECSIVALGSVVLKSIRQNRVLIAGNPAEIVRPLTDRDLFLVTRKTRNDIPDDLAAVLLGELPELQPSDVTPVDA